MLTIVLRFSERADNFFGAQLSHFLASKQNSMIKYSYSDILIRTDSQIHKNCQHHLNRSSNITSLSLHHISPTSGSITLECWQHFSPPLALESHFKAGLVVSGETFVSCFRTSAEALSRGVGPYSKKKKKRKELPVQVFFPSNVPLCGKQLSARYLFFHPLKKFPQRA